MGHLPDLSRHHGFRWFLSAWILGTLVNDVTLTDTRWTVGGGTGCDNIIESSSSQVKGNFSSPGYPFMYGSNLRCIYKFIGLPNQRVRIDLTDFNVRGTYPRCIQDYVDAYIQLDDVEADLLDEPLQARYCGNVHFGNPLISTSSFLVLGFYTDGADSDSARGFMGTYEFIDAEPYLVGTPAPSADCGRIISGQQTPDGTLLSPTYPGVYPRNFHCFYHLEAEPEQRIKVTFLEIDLPTREDHCPYASIRVYDGANNQTDLIATYCGRQANLEVFSTSEHLYIEFSTTFHTFHQRSGSTSFHSSMSGFKAAFQMSKTFAHIDMSTGGQHIRGTECDQRVLSGGETKGTITSPNHPGPYPLGITCRYYLDGLNFPHQHPEKVLLTYQTFAIPSPDEQCVDGKIDIYSRGPGPENFHPDRVDCGLELPASFTSRDPRLLLVLHTSRNTTANGFSATYRFITDHAIPGTQHPHGGCHYLYYSGEHNSGHTDAPGHPHPYPNNAHCIYQFEAQPGEQVRIIFDLKFQLEDRFEDCSTDYLDAYSMQKAPDGSTQETLIGHYCGKLAPGPIISEIGVHMLKLVFHSDYEGYDQGFRARYEFVRSWPAHQSCIMNITEGGGGLIQSTNNPDNATCEWHISTQIPSARILIQLVYFNVEPSDGGCPLAVLKLYDTRTSEVPTYAFCGSDPEIRQLLSREDYIKIKFVTDGTWRARNGAWRARGVQGFKISWTEILPNEGDHCPEFECTTDGYCISHSQRCNGIPNCGVEDTSDERECRRHGTSSGVGVEVWGVLLAGGLVVMVVILTLVARYYIRRNSRGFMNEGEDWSPLTYLGEQNEADRDDDDDATELYPGEERQ